MNCFECAKSSNTVAAVAICQHCGVALCFDHLIETTHSSVGGTHEGCRHEIPEVRPLVDVRAGVDASVQHRSVELV